jgi:hypothetical protein
MRTREGKEVSRSGASREPAVGYGEIEERNYRKGVACEAHGVVGRGGVGCGGNDGGHGDARVWCPTPPRAPVKWGGLGAKSLAALGP